MSRVGKKPVVIPANSKASISGQLISFEGPKGKLKLTVDPSCEVKMDSGSLVFSPLDPNNPTSRAKFGLMRSLGSNMMKGVSEGFSKILEINGVGFRAIVTGKELELFIGFSHSVKYPIPEGITITVEKLTRLTISGSDLQLVGQVAAEIRLFRKPEPYQGKGIKYANEVIRRKAGKAAGAGASSGGGK